VSISQCDHVVHIESQMPGAEGRKIRPGQLEQANCGPESPSILGMVRPCRLLLQVNESPRELNQTLEECVVRPSFAEPEVLEDIMGFVVLRRIEAGKIARVTGVQVRLRGCFRKLIDKGPQALALFIARERGGALSCSSSA
jgi:hypothetical protein